MKNRAITVSLKNIKGECRKLKKHVDYSLRKFSKNNEDLALFLFKSFIGENFRDNLVRHIIERSLNNIGRNSCCFVLKCNHDDHARRLFKTLSEKNFVRFLKSEFSCQSDVSRSEEKIIVKID